MTGSLLRGNSIVRLMDFAPKLLPCLTAVWPLVSLCLCRGDLDFLVCKMGDNSVYFRRLLWRINDLKYISCLSSIQFSHSVMSNSLRPHESQHARPPCPSPTPGIHPDSRPSSQWCHPAISSSVVPFSSCPQSLPASESFPMSQLFTWGGQSIYIILFSGYFPL